MAIIGRRYSEKCFNFLDKFTLRLHSLARPHLGPSVIMEQCPPERSYQLPEPDMQRQQKDSPSLSSFKFWTSEPHFSHVLHLYILAGLKLVPFLRYCLWKRKRKKKKQGWTFFRMGLWGRRLQETQANPRGDPALFIWHFLKNKLWLKKSLHCKALFPSSLQLNDIGFSQAIIRF